jgi:hypothetical protein
MPTTLTSRTVRFASEDGLSLVPITRRFSEMSRPCGR